MRSVVAGASYLAVVCMAPLVGLREVLRRRLDFLWYRHRVTCRTYIYLNGIAGSVKVASMWSAGSTVGIRFLCVYFVL